MQPPKMTFRSQIEPSIKSYECYEFAKFQIGNHNGLMVCWKIFIVFFFQKPRKSKNALYYQENLTRKLFGDFKVGVLFRGFWIWPVLHGDFSLAIKSSIFVQKSHKKKHPKMALRSQIDPLIKSFECFMFNEEVFKNSLI